MERGIDHVFGGTDNHLMLLDLTKKGITGKETEKVVQLCKKYPIYENYIIR